MMTNGDCEGWDFLSHSLTNNGLFLLFTTKFRILFWKHIKNSYRNPKFAEIRHGDVILLLQ